MTLLFIMGNFLVKFLVSRFVQAFLQELVLFVPLQVECNTYSRHGT